MQAYFIYDSTSRCVHLCVLNASRFTGKERDAESGLDNFGARYNASSLGRFMTPDPTMKIVNRLNPQTWNRYAYVINNPLKFIDPLGLWAISYQDELDKKGHLKHRNIIVSKSKEGDDAASLAKQLAGCGKMTQVGNSSIFANQDSTTYRSVFGSKCPEITTLVHFSAAY